MGEASWLKTPEELQFESKDSLLANQEEPSLQMKSRCNLLVEFPLAQGRSTICSIQAST